MHISVIFATILAGTGHVLASGACTVTKNPTNSYLCGGQGTLSNPALISKTAATTTANCAKLCANTLGCKSFSYETNFARCKLLGKPLGQQGYNDHKSKTGVYHYNLNCFTFSDACITTFFLRSKGLDPSTPFDDQYVYLLAKELGQNIPILYHNTSGAAPFTISSSYQLSSAYDWAWVKYESAQGLNTIYVDSAEGVQNSANPEKYKEMDCEMYNSQLHCSPINGATAFYGDYCTINGQTCVCLSYGVNGIEDTPGSYQITLEKVPLFDA